MKKLVCCVTNDLNTDQRMARICGTLAAEGWQVTLVGRTKKDSKPLIQTTYQQHRLHLIFTKGKLFYLEYNLRLLFFLLFKRIDAIVAIDLDTIVPCYYISKWKNIPRVYDAHELFTEMKELIRRPAIQQVWVWVEKKFIPKFNLGYTVSTSIINEFNRRYGVQYELIRNLPLKYNQPVTPGNREKFLIYQGAVNEGRGLEWLIPAMQKVNAPLRIYGNGNFVSQVKDLIYKYGVADKVTMMGTLDPAALREISTRAYAGINLVEHIGLNQIYSLANKFFDYILAGLPQLTMDLPEYRAINDQYAVAVLIPELEIDIIADALNKLLVNAVLYEDLSNNCIRAAEVFNWEQEEQRLKIFYHKILD
jgi:glycosyltransferase involved in cell wall biosynthesis